MSIDYFFRAASLLQGITTVSYDNKVNVFNEIVNIPFLYQGLKQLALLVC
jgi:hypothetical protein